MNFANRFLLLTLVVSLLTVGSQSQAGVGPRMERFSPPAKTGHIEYDRARLEEAIKQHSLATGRAINDWVDKVKRRAITITAVGAVAILGWGGFEANKNSVSARDSARFSPSGDVARFGYTLNKGVALDWLGKYSHDSASLRNFIVQVKKSLVPISVSRDVREMLGTVEKILDQAEAQSPVESSVKSEELAKAAASFILMRHSGSLEGISWRGRDLSIAAAKLILKANLPPGGVTLNVDGATAAQMANYRNGADDGLKVEPAKIELKVLP